MMNQNCIQLGQAEEFVNWTWFIDFYELGTTQGYHSLSVKLLKPSFDNDLYEHGGLPDFFAHSR